jgi:hypothetical protein
MTESPRSGRLASLLANSLTALILPLLVFELDRSHASHAHARYIALLILALLLAVAWPVSMARSRLFSGLSRPWMLSIAIPSAVGTLAVCALVFLGMWSAAYDLSGVVSFAIQLLLFVIFFLPRKAESIPAANASKVQRP